MHIKSILNAMPMVQEVCMCHLCWCLQAQLAIVNTYFDSLYLSSSPPYSHLLMFTFTFQAEGYKLYIPLYYSYFTGKWEVSGLLFLSTETKEKVDAGIRFFKQSLPYNIEGGSRFIFFTDKDFDYITTLCSAL